MDQEKAIQQLQKDSKIGEEETVKKEETEKKIEIVKKPALVKKAQLPKVIENELVAGMNVMDYSHLYKSFYDIFVGSILEPKTFDLQFVMRDTRNTYAAFVSLMTMEGNAKKKYQFEQAPLERSAQDYAQQLGMMPSFFQTSGNGEDLMKQALAQAELKDRYKSLIKHKDINEILKDASQKIAEQCEQATAGSLVAESGGASRDLYYRVVKNRSEVYDIISRSFGRRKAW